MFSELFELEYYQRTTLMVHALTVTALIPSKLITGQDYEQNLENIDILSGVAIRS